MKNMPLTVCDFDLCPLDLVPHMRLPGFDGLSHTFAKLHHFIDMCSSDGEVPDKIDKQCARAWVLLEASGEPDHAGELRAALAACLRLRCPIFENYRHLVDMAA